MKNIRTAIEGSELVIRVDLTKCLDKRTKKGGLYYALTDYAGNHIPGTALKLNMSVWETQGDDRNEPIVVDKEQMVEKQIRSKEAKDRKAAKESSAATHFAILEKKNKELEERLDRQGDTLMEILSLLKKD